MMGIMYSVYFVVKFILLLLLAIAAVSVVILKQMSALQLPSLESMAPSSFVEY